MRGPGWDEGPTDLPSAVVGSAVTLADTSFSFTRSLGINCYSFFHSTDQSRCEAWVRRINSDFSEDALTSLLESIAYRIGARIMHLSSENFVPQGVSASALIAQRVQNSVLGHLDKSHLSVHTYASCDTKTRIYTFRADFDITTCGDVSPLEVLDLIFENGSDLLVVDYRVRGDQTSDLQRIFLEAVAPGTRCAPHR